MLRRTPDNKNKLHVLVNVKIKRGKLSIAMEAKGNKGSRPLEGFLFCLLFGWKRMKYSVSMGKVERHRRVTD